MLNAERGDCASVLKIIEQHAGAVHGIHGHGGIHGIHGIHHDVNHGVSQAGFIRDSRM